MTDIIREGICFRAFTKAKIMQYLLEKSDYRSVILGKIKESGIGTQKISPFARTLMPPEYGLRLTQVSVLDEDVLTEGYRLFGDGKHLEGWLVSSGVERLEQIRRMTELDQKEIRIDCRGLLVWAMVKNRRCRQQLFRLTEQGASDYMGAYEESPYVSAPFFRWLLPEEAETARMGLGLLEQARRETVPGAYTRTVYSLLGSGFHSLRSRVRACKQVEGEDLVSFSSAGGGLMRSAERAAAIVLAQSMGIELCEDLIFYSLVPELEDSAGELLGGQEPGITQAGRESLSKMQEVWDCGGFSDGFFSCRDGGCEAGRRILGIFGLHLAMLQDIRLTEEELEKLFSIDSEAELDARFLTLLAAGLCRHICRIREQAETGKLAEQARWIKEQEAETSSLKRQISGLRHQLRGLTQQKEELQERLKQAGDMIEKKQERLVEARRRRELDRKELDRLRDYVLQLTSGEECQAEMDRGGEEGAAALEAGSSAGQDTAQEAVQEKRQEKVRETSQEKEPGDCCRKLGGMRAIVLGGHENWQRRFREYFPGWQFMPAGKNNFDAGCIQNKDAIIVNTAVMKHSTYYRIMAERAVSQLVLYVHGNNPERCMEELERQLEAMHFGDL